MKMESPGGNIIKNDPYAFTKSASIKRKLTMNHAITKTVMQELVMKSVEEDSSSEDETDLSNLRRNIAKLNADLNLKYNQCIKTIGLIDDGSPSGDDIYFHLDIKNNKFRIIATNII